MKAQMTRAELEIEMERVLSDLQELRAKSPHGGVLLAGIVLRHHYDGRHALALCREGNRLSVVAGRSRDHAIRLATLDALTHVNKTASYLEGAERRMVLVLHPNLATEFIGEHRPGMLQRRLHRPVDNFLGPFQVGLRHKFRHHVLDNMIITSGNTSPQKRHA